MDRQRIQVEYIGPAALHNMPCAVKHEDEPAVLNCNLGIFEPSWAAQREGWKLVRIESRLQRLAYRLLFKRN